MTFIAEICFLWGTNWIFIYSYLESLVIPVHKLMLNCCLGLHNILSGITRIFPDTCWYGDFSCFGMWNLYPKSASNFQLHSVYRAKWRLKISQQFLFSYFHDNKEIRNISKYDILFLKLKKIWNIFSSFVFHANPFHAQGYVLMKMIIDQCISCPLFTFVIGNILRL